MSRSFYVLNTKRSKRRMLPSVNIVHANNTTDVPVSPYTTASTATNRNRNGKSDCGGVVTHSQRPIYVAATRQHCGKTTVCLALMSGLRKRFPHVGFMKPVGQQYVLAPAPGSSDGDSGSSSAVPIDKDVVLMKNHFRLDDADYKLMSPIIVQRGYVKDYIDGKIHHREQLARIQEAYTCLAESNDIILCEGTGHVAVGSVLGLNNAQVAKLIGADMVLVTNGGIGSSFDDLELNRLVCEHYGVNIAGVIINKVKPDKVNQTRDYMTRALSRLNLPVLGCVPDRPFLGCVALADLERLFGVQLISGSDQRMKHYSYEGKINMKKKKKIRM
jgi:dethiobiotin synthetase